MSHRDAGKYWCFAHNQMGKDMKNKMLVSLIACMAVMPAMAKTGKGYHFGNNDSCIIYRDGKLKNRKYWWCGKKQDSCGGWNVKKSSKHGGTYTHGKYLTWPGDGNEKYYCCVSESGKPGKFIIEGAEGFYSKIETVEKSVGGGTCNKVIKYDVCGGQVIEDCNKPDTCPSGQKLRNDTCAVASCPYGQAFASATSNQCIDCAPSNSQGVNYAGICVKCPDGYFFQSGECYEKATGDLIDTGSSLEGTGADITYVDENGNEVSIAPDKVQTKVTVTTYTNYTLRMCYACTSSELYKMCVDLFNKPIADRSRDADAEAVKQNCSIEDYDLTTSTNTPSRSQENNSGDEDDGRPDGTACTDGYTQACSVANGTGVSTCQDGYWGVCMLQSCNKGYTKVGNNCVASSADDEDGDAEESSSSSGASTVCTPNAREACTMANGTGFRNCTSTGSGWSKCRVQSCNPGYKPSYDYLSCVADAADDDNDPEQSSSSS